MRTSPVGAVVVGAGIVGRAHAPLAPTVPASPAERAGP
jgi:hypothetical protein